jgi:hypothetical protein
MEAELAEKEQREQALRHQAQVMQNNQFTPSANDLAATAATLQSLSAHGLQMPSFDLSSILPLHVLNSFLEDFFTYIHPLAPIPHQPSFAEEYQSFTAPGADTNTVQHLQFIALVASMVGALVASCPSRPLKQLKGHHLEGQFPSHYALIHHCHEIASKARNDMGFHRLDNVSWYDVITSYFLGLAKAYTFEIQRGTFYFQQSLSLIRLLYDPNKPTEDRIAEQYSRRLFWIIVVGVRWVLIWYGRLQN